MDIVVCLDCSSSITSFFNAIRSTILSIVNKTLVYHPSDVRIALIEFRSHTDYSVTNIHPFTSSMDTFKEWINAVKTDGGGPDGSKAVGKRRQSIFYVTHLSVILVDALSASLTLDWRPNVNVNRYHEKLVILITDGPPCGLLDDECPCDSQDLWSMVNEFEKQDITLTVVGVEPSVVVCDDFYCALAKKTGMKDFQIIKKVFLNF
jgi:Mg-chelatase subunit ChlD